MEPMIDKTVDEILMKAFLVSGNNKNERQIGIDEDALVSALMKVENLRYESEKIVVPQFVADFYEMIKNGDIEFNMYKIVMDHYQGRYKERYPEFHNWLNNTDNNGLTTLLRMRNCYKVEEEKLYYIKLPTNKGPAYVNYDVNEHIHFDGFKGTQFTEQEIKEIDERYWAFKEEVE